VRPSETSAGGPHVNDGLGPHGDRAAVCVPEHREAVLATAGDVVKRVDHRLELSVDLDGRAVGERDRAGGHAVHRIVRGEFGLLTGVYAVRGRQRVRRRRVSCLFLSSLLREELEEVRPMSPTPVAHRPAIDAGPGR
jgi:hypothetical protein